MSNQGRVLALVLMCGVFGCERTARTGSSSGEASALLRALERLQLAPNEQKRVFLERLAALECADECALQRSCVLAYQRHVDAWEDIRRIRLESARHGEDAGRRAVALNRLDAAQGELDAAQRAIDSCISLQGRVARGE